MCFLRNVLLFTPTTRAYTYDGDDVRAHNTLDDVGCVADNVGCVAEIVVRASYLTSKLTSRANFLDARCSSGVF